MRAVTFLCVFSGIVFALTYGEAVNQVEESLRKSQKLIEKFENYINNPAITQEEKVRQESLC